jgi:rRNA-processing protein FCF1
MKKILLDSNVFIYSIKQKIDIFSSLQDILQEPFELVTTESVVKELEKMSKSAKKDSAYAKASLKLMEKMGVKVIPNKHEYADKDILALANEDIIVITNDKKLKEKLKKKTRVMSLGVIKKIR